MLIVCFNNKFQETKKKAETKKHNQHITAENKKDKSVLRLAGQFWGKKCKKEAFVL